MSPNDKAEKKETEKTARPVGQYTDDDIKYFAKRFVLPEDAKAAGIHPLSCATWELLKAKNPTFPHPGGKAGGIAGFLVVYPPTLDGIRHFRVRPHGSYYFVDTVDGRGKRVDFEGKWFADPGGAVPYVPPEVLETGRSTPIVIVESPIKMLAVSRACRELGLPHRSVGLGGVEAGGHVPNSPVPALHPELKRIDWRGRLAIIVFDVNIHANPNVARGAARLALALAAEGATVRIAFLPPVSEHDLSVDEIVQDPGAHLKYGPDDYLTKHGPEALRQVIESAVPADPVERIRSIPGRSRDVRRSVVLSLMSELYFVASLKFGGPAVQDAVAAEVKDIGVGKATLKQAVKVFDAQVSAKAKSRNENDARVFGLGDHRELRDAVLTDLTVGGDRDVIKFSQGKLWKYDADAGVWTELADAAVINAVARYSGAIVGAGGRPLKITSTTTKGVLDLVKADREDRKFFDAMVSGIAFKNGFLTIDPKTGARLLVPHSRNHRARFVYPFEYTEGAIPSRYLAFLERLSRDKTGEEKRQTIACLTEHLGASIAGMAPRFEKAVFLLGAGGTGNSTIIQVHAAAMPAESVCSIMPQMMENNFHLAGLAGKLLNVVDDLPKDELRNSGVWKSTITGGTVRAAFKNRDAFDFAPRAGNLLACNVLPPTSDVTRGFRRRVAVLQFGSIIDEHEKNRNLVNDILDELPALVTYALARLSAAIERNALTVPESSTALVDAWLKVSAPFEEFFDEHLRVLSDAEHAVASVWTKASAIYEQYQDWARTTGHKPLSSTTFGENMKTKLVIGPAEWTKAPFKREHGRYYPVAFTEAAKAEAADHEAARPSASTPEEHAAIQAILDKVGGAEQDEPMVN